MYLLLFIYIWCVQHQDTTISLTSVVCKCMEHIIVSQIMKHLEKNNILTDSQFGFRAHHSCKSQLFVTINLTRFAKRGLIRACTVLGLTFHTIIRQIQQ